MTDLNNLREKITDKELKSALEIACKSCNHYNLEGCINVICTIRDYLVVYKLSIKEELPYNWRHSDMGKNNGR